MDAAPTTRIASSRRSVPNPKTTTVAKRVTTPLPTSSQLTRIIGASTSKPNACVALSRRCQAIQLTSVVKPATAKRRRERAQGQAARTAAVSTPATTADTYVTDTPYISDPPLACTVLLPAVNPPRYTRSSDVRPRVGRRGLTCGVTTVTLLCIVQLQGEEGADGDRDHTEE